MQFVRGYGAACMSKESRMNVIGLSSTRCAALQAGHMRSVDVHPACHQARLEWFVIHAS